MRWVLGFALALAGCFVFACRDNPNIDGTKVAATGATCTEVCGRIVKLCGYAPPDCDDDVDAAGYCQTNFDDTILACMSTTTSCQQLWDDSTPTGCLFVAPAPEDDASTDDATDDGATGDGATE